MRSCCAALPAYYGRPEGVARPPTGCMQAGQTVDVFARARASNLGSACSVCLASGCSSFGASRSTRLSSGWRANLPSVFRQYRRSFGVHRALFFACASTISRTVRSSPVRGTLDRQRQLGRQPSRARPARSCITSRFASSASSALSFRTWLWFIYKILTLYGPERSRVTRGSPERFWLRAAASYPENAGGARNDPHEIKAGVWRR